MSSCKYVFLEEASQQALRGLHSRISIILMHDAADCLDGRRAELITRTNLRRGRVATL